MPGAADLVTLAQVRAYVDGAAGVLDTKLSGLIKAISMAILAATGRGGILPASYTEVADGSAAGVMLKNWPVLSVESVEVAGCYGAPTLLAASANGSAGYLVMPEADSQSGAPQMLTAPYGGLVRGDGNVKVTYTAGYQVADEAATAAASVIVAETLGSWGSDRGVKDGNGNAMVRVAVAPQQGQYQVAAGTYAFAAADAGIPVLISYGYIPADLANAALEWIADRIAYQNRVGLSSQSLGGQETTSFKLGKMPDFVAAMIMNYVNVVPV